METFYKNKIKDIFPIYSTVHCTVHPRTVNSNFNFKLCAYTSYLKTSKPSYDNFYRHRCNLHSKCNYCKRLFCNKKLHEFIYVVNKLVRPVCSKYVLYSFKISL